MKGILLSELAEFLTTIHPAVRPTALPAHVTAFGHYPDTLLLRMVDDASGTTGIAKDAILERFGAHLFGRLAALHPAFLVGADSALDLLGAVNERIHDEIRELHPDAEVPHFDVRAPGPGRLEMTYRSRRPFAALALGMIRGCIAHFAEPLTVASELLDARDGRAARFTVVAREDD